MRKTRIIWFLLMICVMVFIFALSNQSLNDSSKFSNEVAKAINIKPPNAWTSPSFTEVAFGLNIRKYAHILLFALLGVTAIGFLNNIPKAFLICFIYAMADEIHQLFVSGRTASIKDIAIDTVGFGTVLIIWKIIMTVKNFVKRN